MAALLPGTLDVLVLKAVSLGSEHGYGLLLRIQRLSQGVLELEQGALYPALARLEVQGLIESEWGVSQNNRRAKFYSLTRAGRTRLGHERAAWDVFAAGMSAVLGATRAEGSG